MPSIDSFLLQQTKCCIIYLHRRNQFQIFEDCKKLFCQICFNRKMLIRCTFLLKKYRLQLLFFRLCCIIYQWTNTDGKRNLHFLPFSSYVNQIVLFLFFHRIIPADMIFPFRADRLCKISDPLFVQYLLFFPIILPVYKMKWLLPLLPITVDTEILTVFQP